MGTIWRRESDEWQKLSPSGFPSEEKLHDLVESAPSLLPLSGDPSLVVLGREVALGPGYADLVAVEPDGRMVIVEIKLGRNSEARRAVIGQILTYAAYLKGLSIPALEEVLRPHLDKAEAGSLLRAGAPFGAVRRSRGRRVRRWARRIAGHWFLPSRSQGAARLERP